MHSDFRSSLEPLEARIAPAALSPAAVVQTDTVKVTSAGGSVKIIGDTGNNDITLQILSPGKLQITGNNGTLVSFNGQTDTSAVVNPYSRDISVALGVGDDAVTLEPGLYYGNVNLDGGVGHTSFTFDGGGAYAIAGSLKVTGKVGSQSLSVSDSGYDFEVGRDFLVSLGAGGATSTLAATRLFIGGKLSIAGGTLADSFDWGTTGDLGIGGDVTIATGDDVDMVNFHAGGDLGITGKLTVKGGNTTPHLPPSGNLTASYSFTAADQLEVRGLVTASSAGGSTTFDFTGTNVTEFAHGLTVKEGKGSTTFTLGGASQSYLGKVAITSSGTSSLLMKPTSFFVGGDFTFKGGAGVDTIDLEGDGIITGKASIDLGAGDSQTLTFTAPDLLAVLGAASFKQSARTDTAGSTTTISGLAAYSFSLTTGANDDTVNLDNLSIRHGTTISLGVGDDNLKLDTSTASGPTVLSGGVKLLLGDGDDHATFGGNGTSNVVIYDATPGSLIDGGKGSDTLTGVNSAGMGTNGNSVGTTVVNVEFFN